MEKYDSGWSRTTNKSIHFYKHVKPLVSEYKKTVAFLRLCERIK